MKKKVIGILALQGAVEAHFAHIRELGAEPLGVRDSAGLSKVDALIIPGGESSTMLKLLKIYDMMEVLSKRMREIPVWGICAGCILLGKRVLNPEQYSFGLLDIDVERNGYGRQLDSHIDFIDGYEIQYIRAPIIVRVGSTVEVKARHRGQAVWVESGNVIATTFHPELNKNVPSMLHRTLYERI